VKTYETNTYLTADTEDWDAIQAIVSDLEDTLMGCDAITTQLAAIASQLACLCTAAQAQGMIGPSTGALVDEYLDDGTLVPDDVFPNEETDDADRCALAQVVYWQAWEVFTETLLPLAEATSDILMAKVLVTLAAVLGAGVLGVPAGVILAIAAGLGYIIATGAIEDFSNGYRANEEALICAVYRGLETSYREAEAQAVAVMSDIDGWSGTDKIMAHMLYCPWAMMIAKRAIAAGTPKALSFIQSGYCSECDIIEGDDWWAIYLPEDSNTVDIVQASSPAWTAGCWNYALPSGYVTNGVVLDVVSRTGGGILKRMGAAEAGCSGTEMWGNTSPDLPVGEYFCVMPTGIDEVQCKAALAPGSTTYDNTYSRTGPLDINCGFHLGYNMTGEAHIWVKYIVFRGSPP